MLPDVSLILTEAKNCPLHNPGKARYYTYNNLYSTLRTLITSGTKPGYKKQCYNYHKKKKKIGTHQI